MLTTIPKDAAKARPMLDQIRTQRLRCTIFVVLAGTAGQDLADRVEIRAAGHPLRQTVWVSDPAVLKGVPGYQALNAAVASGAVGCALTMKFDMSSTFSDQNVGFRPIEDAFIKAETDA